MQELNLLALGDAVQEKKEKKEKKPRVPKPETSEPLERRPSLREKAKVRQSVLGLKPLKLCCAAFGGLFACC